MRTRVAARHRGPLVLGAALLLTSCVTPAALADPGYTYTGTASASESVGLVLRTDYTVDAHITSACRRPMTMSLTSSSGEAAIALVSGAAPVDRVQHLWLTSSVRTVAVSDPGGCAWSFTMRHQGGATPAPGGPWR